MRFRKLKNINKNNNTANKTKEKYIYARFIDRVKAFITDMFMIYMPIMYFITYIVLSGKEDLQGSEVALFIAVATYAIIYALLVSNFGNTPGKNTYDLKILDDKSGEKINFFRALYRYVMFLFTMTTVLGAFLPFYRKDKKALHDLICHTVVARIKEED